MPDAIRFLAILLAVSLSVTLTGLGVGCASTVRVAFDEREDFSRYRTWGWLPHGVPNVDAPHGDPHALDARVAKLIERELLASGLERAAGRPDLLVRYHLTLRRRAVVVEEPAAPYLLSSHNSSASYWIEGSRKAIRIQEHVRLAIRFSARGRTIWRATLLRTLEDAPVLSLDDAVSTLLERYPRPAPWNEANEADPRP